VNIPAVASAVECSVAAVASRAEYPSGRKPYARRVRLTSATSDRARSDTDETLAGLVLDEGVLCAEATLDGCD